MTSVFFVDHHLCESPMYLCGSSCSTSFRHLPMRHRSLADITVFVQPRSLALLSFGLGTAGALVWHRNVAKRGGLAHNSPRDPLHPLLFWRQVFWQYSVGCLSVFNVLRLTCLARRMKTPPTCSTCRNLRRPQRLRPFQALARQSRLPGILFNGCLRLSLATPIFPQLLRSSTSCMPSSGTCTAKTNSWLASIHRNACFQISLSLSPLRSSSG